MIDEQTTGGLFTALLLSGAVTWIAMRNGYYRFPHLEQRSPLPFRYLLGAFGSYLISAFLILPLIYLGVSYFFLGGQLGGFSTLQKNLPKEQIIVAYLLSFFIIAVALFIYLLLIDRTLVKRVLGLSKPFWRNIGFGALTLIVAYPVVLLVNSVVSMLAKHLFGAHGVEQTAVKELKSIAGHPILFAFMAIMISTVVPIVEEILFRGFLQSYLKQYLGRKGAIILASALFALAHFSFTAGTGNIELIVSLFALSSYLGFIFERQETIYAPIGLHMCFNASTVIGILFLKSSG